MLSEKGACNMIRTQIQLTEKQARMLKEISLKDNESIAALIRRAVDQFLVTGKPDRPTLYRQAAAIVGKYTAEQPDISIEHDRYLDEAYGL